MFVSTSVLLVHRALPTYHLLQQLLAHTPDIVFFKDRESRYIEFNDTLLQLTGVPRERMIGQDTSSFLDQALTAEIIKSDRMVMASRVPQRTEQWVEFADGRMVLMDTIIAPIIDEEGNVLGLLGIGRDITALMQTSIALKEQNLALAKTNRELDSLIYHAAHDLRAPLTSLLGLINVMRDEQDPSRIQRYLDLQAAKIHQLDSFIQDIVNLSKNSREGIVIANVDLEDLFWGVVEQYKFLPGTTGMTFELTSDGLPTLRSDAGRLQVALAQLVNNAIRYHDPAKAVRYLRLHAQIAADTVTLRLEDNGLGIEAHHLPHIFEMFYRGNASSKGSGIGLYIAQETIQKLGGNITVDSELGVGSTFSVVIPNHLGHPTQLE